ncbi:MAG: FHA domain-containing protein, partial [Gemmataceae bacterium]
PVLGSMAAPMAAVLSSPVISAQDSSGLILVIDADGHAMTLSVVERTGGELRLRVVQSSPHVQRGLWLRRLVDGAASRCVRQCRRDPRESAQTEQYLYEQFVHLLDQGNGRPVQMHLQGEGWFHHLFLQAEDMAGMVLPLLRLLQTDIQSVLGTLESMGPLSAVVATQSAVGLPGVIPLLRNRLNARPPTPAPTTLADEDYGDLLLRVSSLSVGVYPLPPDALSCLAHELAVRVHSGDFPRGHLNTVRLPQASPTSSLSDQGPARLFYRGQEHPLGGGNFTLGRDPSCDLVFESELFPQVSARHCDIQFDRRAYMILDRSRHGTLVNDRPVRQQASLNSGDWIRLGPRGPVLRFLGEASLTR